MNPLTQVITICLCVVIFIIPRRLLLVPFVIGMCFVPADQSWIVFGANLHVIRIMVLAGIGRLFLKGEVGTIKVNIVDTLIIVWGFLGLTVYFLHDFSFGDAWFKFGVLLELFGFYWIFRQLLCSWIDIKFSIAVFLTCMLILLPFVIKEHITASNPFEVLGRVHTVIREGRFRCEASFPHSIMFGSFAAAIFPLSWGLFKTGEKRNLTIAGLIVSAYFVFASASSGPLMALLGGVFFLFFFKYRHHSKSFIWTAIGFFILLQIVTNAPFYHSIWRIPAVGGSAGWHRVVLLDGFINHFGEWWLLGTRNVEGWGVFKGDVTNQYVLEGVRGGLISFVVFIILIVICIKTLTRFSLQKMTMPMQWFVWGICVSMIVHCISFFSVSYFGQISMLLYWTFAVIAFVKGELDKVVTAGTIKLTMTKKTK